MPEKKVTKVEFPVKPSETKKQFPRKRVVAYARVSTMKDAQENSLKSQRAYYTKHIKSNPEWVFAGMYTDDGISGLSMRNRDGFNRMIEDAMAGKIDLILTKSLSRFARNTVDSLTTIRKLKAVGVAVYFEKENINTFDAGGEFLITLMSSFAEEESRSISENVTWSVRHRFAQGIYHISPHLLGYGKDDCGETVIVESEARIIRFIYMLALSGKTPFHIAKMLNDYEIPSPMDSIWIYSTVKNILTNEKYKGDAILQKRYTVDFLTKKMKDNTGEVPQYYVENGHPAIISKDAWSEAQNVFSEPQSYTPFRPLSRKIICGHCGGKYGTKIWHSTTTHDIVWQCNNRVAGKTKCHCPHIYDYELTIAVEIALQALFKRYTDTIVDCKELLLRTLPNAPQAVYDRITIAPTFDSLAQSVLITKMTVTEHYNIVFHFIDGSTYRYRMTARTPKSRPGAYERKQNYERVIEFYRKGTTSAEIARILGIDTSTVNSFLRRWHNKI